MHRDIESAIRSEFIEEAKELLESAELSFIELEKDPSNREVLNNVFRYLHTLKGSGLAAGFDDFGKFAHQLENLLDRMRAGELRHSSEIQDAMLRAVDVMNEHVKKLELDHKALFEPRGSIRELSALIQGVGPSAETTATESTACDPSEEPLLKGFFDKKLLICEDSLELAKLMKENFQICGIKHVDLALDGNEAWEKISEVQYDLILTDFKMPGLSGIDVLAKLRADNHATPVVIISGYAERDHIAEMLRLGAFDFIEKPVDMNRLEVVARNALLSGMVKSSMEELGLEIYRAFVKVMRIVDPAAPKKDIDELEKHIENVSKLTNFIMTETRDLDTSRESSVA